MAEPWNKRFSRSVKLVIQIGNEQHCLGGGKVGCGTGIKQNINLAEGEGISLGTWQFSFQTGLKHSNKWASQVVLVAKNPLASTGDIRDMGSEEPLKAGTTAHSRVLAWRIPWIEEPGGLQSIGSQRVRQDKATNRLIVQTRWKEVPRCTFLDDSD